MTQEKNFLSEVRLNKFLAQSGVCSRRSADEMIAQGRIMVNGVRAEMGAKLIPDQDHVTLDGKPVLARPRNIPHTYIILNKPVQVVSTVRDPQGRSTVLDLIPCELKNKRLYPVGRLDFFSEGLLILTDDGKLTHRLTHPGWHLPKTYHVVIRGNVSEEALTVMSSGMRLAEGETLAPVQASVLRKDGRTTWLKMVLHQGVNRQIRRMCRDLDMTILSLKRVAVGPLQLGRLQKGQSRLLTAKEVQALYHAVGLA